MTPIFKTEQLKPTLPEWLVKGCFVKTMGWCGKVVEIAESDRAYYIRVFGAKSVYYGNAGGDFLEYIPGMIEQATQAEVIRNYRKYDEMEQDRYAEIGKMAF